ncbi:MAG: phage late control D family protein [Pseudohongiellaceae bacterium]
MREWNTRQSSQPPRKPDYRITLPDRTISRELEARLISLTLTDRRGTESDQVDIILSDHDGRLEIPPRGAELHVAIGWSDTGLVDRGTYIVDEVEHSGPPDQLTIRGRAADMQHSLPGRRSQSWDNVTVGEILESIAGRHSLGTATNQDLMQRTIEHIDQTDESDMHFLTRLGERFDAVATIKAGRLLFVPASEGQTASGTPIPPITLTRSDGDQHTFTIAERNQYSGVITYWQDYEEGTRDLVLVGSDENPLRKRETFESRESARTAAEAEWQRVQRAGDRISLTLHSGRPEIHPETPFRVSGWKTDIEEVPWVIAEIVHSIDGSRFTSSLQLEPLNLEDLNT